MFSRKLFLINIPSTASETPEPFSRGPAIGITASLEINPTRSGCSVLITRSQASCGTLPIETDG